MLFKKPTHVKDDYISTYKFYIIISTCLGNVVYLDRFDREEISTQTVTTTTTTKNPKKPKQTKIKFKKYDKENTSYVDTCM